MTERRGPVLIEEEDPATLPDPGSAPAVPEAGPPVPEGAAMLRASRIAAGRQSWIGRLFWGSAVMLLGAFILDAAIGYAAGLITSGTVFGWAILALMALFALSLILILVREGFALARLSSVEDTRALAIRARSEMSLAGAKTVAGRIHKLYRARPDLSWARADVQERADAMFDADALIDHVEASYMRGLDAAAAEEIRIAARQVAGATAVIPLALADVAVALTANLRMIRRIAEIYGGRAGTLGAWRLFRTVAAHLIATGAVAAGDDLIGSILGGSVLARVSRRFGEGVVNGALTARVGVAAMEVCRPLPFQALKRPSVSALVKTALTGLFNGSRTQDPAG